MIFQLVRFTFLAFAPLLLYHSNVAVNKCYKNGICMRRVFFFLSMSLLWWCYSRALQQQTEAELIKHFFFHSTLSSITNDALKIHFQIWTVRSMWNKCSIGTVVVFFFFRQLEASHWIFGGKRSIDTVAAWKKTNKIREIDENPCKLSITTSTKYSSSRRQRH